MVLYSATLPKYWKDALVAVFNMHPDDVLENEDVLTYSGKGSESIAVGGVTVTNAVEALQQLYRKICHEGM